MIRSLLPTLLAGCVLAFGAEETSAGKFNKKVNIGDKAAVWKELPGTDGEKHSLDDYKDAEVLVIAFTCNHCPVANAYEERFNKLAETYKDKKVGLVAISISDSEVDSLENMKQRASDKSYQFDYLQDLSQESGRSYGALVTPHLFVLDKDRKIAYMGAFDDSINPAQTQKHYVMDAVKALLDGKQLEIKESLQFGCGIEYKRK